MSLLELADVTVTAPATGAQQRSPRELPDLARFLIASITRADEPEVPVLSGISFGFEAGCLAVLGEEGAGKSALVAVLARALQPESGAVLLDGTDVYRARGRARRLVRKDLQVLLDDVDGGFDPRLTLGTSFTMFARALRLNDPLAAAHAALARVGLASGVLDQRAEALGAGELRRAAIARALLPQPRVLVLDEPTRGLDPFEHAAVERVLAGLVSQGALVVATRDIALARVIATRVAVLEHGLLVEFDDADRVFFAPQHPATRALVAASPQARAVRALAQAG